LLKLRRNRSRKNESGRWGDGIVHCCSICVGGQFPFSHINTLNATRVVFLGELIVVVVEFLLQIALDLHSQTSHKGENSYIIVDIFTRNINNIEFQEHTIRAWTWRRK
jgi:hypothetical protein